MSSSKPKKSKAGTAAISATFFATQEDFRKWLEVHHETESELIVGFYKVDSGLPSMTWSQSVDQALCFGWIDGIRKSIDSLSYCIRFTPRRKGSTWSAINISKVEVLSKAGLMKPAGLEAYSWREADKSGTYSYENDTLFLDSAHEAAFKANKRAWDFFTSQAPSYQKAIMRWIMSARQEKTRQSRLEKAIHRHEQQKRLS
jgi:uncharacterized protein YdeI (YjbR/CyaY-like superfamily)